jgi:hypothetical protein
VVPSSKNFQYLEVMSRVCPWVISKDPWGRAEMEVQSGVALAFPRSLLYLACIKTTDQANPANPLPSLSHAPEMNLARRCVNENHDQNLERL